MDRYQPRYNVSPGANLPVVRREDGADGEDGVVLHCMKWGLIPSFTKKTEKPDHYRMDGRPLLFAALYDSWENSEGEKIYTFTIITTPSSSALGWLHDRMPVVLGDKESVDTWLDGSSASNFDKLLKPYEGPDLVWYPVTPAMGKVSFDGPECSNEIKLKTDSTKSITKFFSTMGTKKEEINPKDAGLHDSSVKTEFPESVNEEPETKEERVKPSSTVKCEDSKGSFSTLSQEDASKAQTKRDYEEFLADSKPVLNESDKKSGASPAKKVNLKTSHDKQPTLFSYFGKS
ncbi:hypothetical protein ACLB2K_019973 [Fragaria x ananassa]